MKKSLFLTVPLLFIPAVSFARCSFFKGLAGGFVGGMCGSAFYNRVVEDTRPCLHTTRVIHHQPIVHQRPTVLEIHEKRPIVSVLGERELRLSGEYKRLREENEALWYRLEQQELAARKKERELRHTIRMLEQEIEDLTEQVAILRAKK